MENIEKPTESAKLMINKRTHPKKKYWLDEISNEKQKDYKIYTLDGELFLGYKYQNDELLEINRYKGSNNVQIREMHSNSHKKSLTCFGDTSTYSIEFNKDGALSTIKKTDEKTNTEILNIKNLKQINAEEIKSIFKNVFHPIVVMTNIEINENTHLNQIVVNLQYIDKKGKNKEVDYIPTDYEADYDQTLKKLLKGLQTKLNFNNELEFLKAIGIKFIHADLLDKLEDFEQ